MASVLLAPRCGCTQTREISGGVVSPVTSLALMWRAKIKVKVGWKTCQVKCVSAIITVGISLKVSVQAC